jgi:acetoacetate decarboxylase
MKHETVRANAFAMPLTNPAFPAGPYRFVNREYFIDVLFDDDWRLP